MDWRRLSLRARLAALFGPAPSDVRQSLSALGLGLVAALAAGLTLGGISETLERLPGLLVLVPAAIGLRGTIFGALGARLSTAIHTGQFRLSWRYDTIVGQNVLASGVLTLVTSVLLALLAKVTAVAFGISQSISVLEFVVISVVGGVLSSAVVLVLTIALAAASVRYGWDSDNVMAPLVTAAGDMVTLPLLYLATFLVDYEVFSALVAASASVCAVAALVAALRTRLSTVNLIVRESMIVVLFAGALSLVAGLTLEGRMASLARYPALLALVPPFLAGAGSVGGILSSRLTSKLHLGLLEPLALPQRPARSDIALAYLLAVPTFALASVVADLAAVLVNLKSPGPLDMVLIALVGGLLATTFAVAIAYYTAVASFRVGFDPDNFAIPMVTSSIDLFGSASFIIAVAMFVPHGGV